MTGFYLWAIFIAILVPSVCSIILKYTTRDRYFRSVYDGSIWRVVDVVKKRNNKYYILKNVTTFDVKTVLKKNLKSKFE